MMIWQKFLVTYPLKYLLSFFSSDCQPSWAENSALFDSALGALPQGNDRQMCDGAIYDESGLFFPHDLYAPRGKLWSWKMSPLTDGNWFFSYSPAVLFWVAVTWAWRHTKYAQRAVWMQAPLIMIRKGSIFCLSNFFYRARDWKILGTEMVLVWSWSLKFGVLCSGCTGMHLCCYSQLGVKNILYLSFDF